MPTDSPEPLVVSCSADRDGVTYGIDLASRRMLKQRFGSEVQIAPRIFIAHEAGSSFTEIRRPLRKQLLALLTGLSEARLKELGTVEFRDPVTDGALDQVEAALL